MANVRNTNTLYFDSTGTLASGDQIRVTHVIVTATASSSDAVIADPSNSSALKLKLDVPTSADSKLFDFSANPIRFPSGVEVTTLTNAIITCVYTSG